MAGMIIWALATLAIALSVAVPLGYCLSRRSQARKRAADLEVEAAELRREAENWEFTIGRLDTLEQQTGFDVSVAREQAQKALKELQRGERQSDR
jgi:hypothetical protein